MPSIEIRVTENITLDAGAILETEDRFTVDPPTRPMIDQLIAALDDMPAPKTHIPNARRAVGMNALCVRWGSYLATLMDPSTSLHPAIPGFHRQQPEEYSFISQTEMMRMNVEVSYNVYRLVQIFRSRGENGLDELLGKASMYLPMPHKQVTRSKEMMETLIAGITWESIAKKVREEQGQPEDGQVSARIRREILRKDADRFLANTIACYGWRATSIENVHAGDWPPESLKPHQQRFTDGAQRKLLKQVTANMGAVLFMFDTLFNETYRYKDFPSWPETATAVANSMAASWAMGWSMSEASVAMTLLK